MRRKVLLILLPLTLILVAAGFMSLRWWWYRGYSKGSRTGIIRKLSTKGSPICKYLSGEMALIGSQGGQAPTIWEFTVDDDSPNNPIVMKLHEAAKLAKEVTVDYRQDFANKGKLWVCAPTDYYVVGVE